MIPRMLILDVEVIVVLLTIIDLVSVDLLWKIHNSVFCSLIFRPDLDIHSVILLILCFVPSSACSSWWCSVPM